MSLLGGQGFEIPRCARNDMAYARVSGSGNLTPNRIVPRKNPQRRQTPAGRLRLTAPILGQRSRVLDEVMQVPVQQELDAGQQQDSTDDDG